MLETIQEQIWAREFKVKDMKTGELFCRSSLGDSWKQSLMENTLEWHKRLDTMNEVDCVNHCCFQKCTED